MIPRLAPALLVLASLAFVPSEGRAHEEARPRATLQRAVAPLKLGDAVPATRFVDQDGVAFAFAQVAGNFALVSFVYTRCRDADVCPLISAKFARLQNRLGSDVRLVEVTLDPAYDRPPVLRRYARQFGFRSNRVTLLTGEPNDVLEFAARFGITAFSDPEYGLVHDATTALIDRQGRLGELFPQNSWTPDEIVSVVAHYQSRPRLALGGPLTALAAGVVFAFAWLALRLLKRTTSGP